jgi:hypothetical protein
MLRFAPAEPDRVVKWITRLTLPLVIAVYAGLALLSQERPVGYAFAGALLLLSVIYYFCWAYRPVAFDVASEGIIIHRQRIRPVFLPWTELAAVREVDLHGSSTLRLCGVGGLYYFGGLFWNRQVGKFYTSVTSFKRPVLIGGRDIRSWLISPADPDGFVAAAAEHVTASAG